MPYCSRCRTEVVGRYCSGCGALAANPPMVVDIAPPESAALRAFPNPGTFVEANKPAGYVRPMSGAPAPSLGATENNRFTERAGALLQSTGEGIAWQGKPSPIILLPPIVGWSFVVLIAFAWAVNIGRGWGWLGFWIACACVHVGSRWLSWKNTLYRISSQRLEYSGGIFTSSTVAIPLIEVDDVTIRRPLYLSFLKLGNVELNLPDQTRKGRNGEHPRLVLRAIDQLESVRDLIHSSSNITGQLWDRMR